MARSVLLSPNGPPIVTNAEKHSAESWAVLSASIIFPIETAGEGQAIAARKFQIKIAEILQPHHQKHQDKEGAALKAKGDAQLDIPLDINPDSVVAEIVAAAKGTPFEEYCVRPEWQAIAKQEIGNHLATSSHIERQWHCHRSSTPVAKAWLDQHHQGIKT